MIAFDYLVGKRTGLQGQLRQNALNFRLFLAAQDADFVVRLDHAHRLDKKRRAGGGGVVHQTLDVRAAFRLNGYDIAAVADGHDGVL